MPIGEDVELNLGPDPDVLIERKIMKLVKLNFTTDTAWRGVTRMVGYDTKVFFETRVKNTKDLTIQFEIECYFSGDWELESELRYDKLDEHNVRFVIQLEPGKEKVFKYTLTQHHGKNSRR